MQAKAVVREILYPLTDMAVVLALIIFLLLEVLTEAAGLLALCSWMRALNRWPRT